MNIDNHLLIEAIYKPSPNFRGTIVPTLVVIHYTGDNSLQGALGWLTKQGSGVSAPLLIGRKGALYQMVPFDKRAWHAGKSSYNGTNDCNSYAIGIECVGTGKTWPKQLMDRLYECLDAIMRNYEIEDIVGHDDVARPVGRKPDPGPNFPWGELNERYWT